MTYESIIEKIRVARDLPARVGSFERFRAALRAAQDRGLEFPADGRGVILIAGTNGKGTVAKTLECLLRLQCKAVGLFTSPHMMETTERVRSFGRDLSRAEFVEAYRLVSPIVDQWNLSHFEILTLMMAEVFFGGRVRERVERAVIEVGVGGRLDPTRLIPHETSVVTTLGLDHQEILGETLLQIGREKFAIVDRGNLVVHAPLPVEARDCVSDAKGLAATWVEAEIFPHRVEKRAGDPVWILQTPWGEAELSLAGERAVQNVSIALHVLRAQGADLRRLLPGVAEVLWPCRMEKFVVRGRRVYLSGDHNPQGVQSLRELLREFEYERVHLVVGIGKNKDQPAMLEMFSQIPRSLFYLTTTPFRPAALEDYGHWVNKAHGAFVDQEQALRAAIEAAGERDLVLVSGSLYLAGHLRQALVDGRFKSP